MKQLLAVLLLGLSFNAIAAVEVNTYGLTDAQKAKLIQAAEQMKDEAANPTSAEKVSEWVDVGTKIGLGLASAAKELGVQANQFATTPVGKVTMALIVYKVAGRDIVKIIGAFTLLLASWFAGTRLSKLGRSTRTRHDTTKKNIFGNYPVESVEVGELSEGYAFGVYAFYAFGVIGCFITLINI